MLNILRVTYLKQNIEEAHSVEKQSYENIKKFLSKTENLRDAQ